MIQHEEDVTSSSAVVVTTHPADQFVDCCGSGSDTMMEPDYHQSLHEQHQQQQEQQVEEKEEEEDEEEEPLIETYDTAQRDALTDVLNVLKFQEASYGRCDGGDGLLPYLHDSWRPVMVSWMFSVIDAFSLMPEIVTTGIYYLDTCGPSVSKEDYPLLTMAALNVAVKCHETKMFPLDQLVELMGGSSPSNRGCSGSGKRRQPQQYVPDDVIEMERTIVRVCQWKLHPPTAHEFLNQYVEVISDECDRTIVSTQAVSHLKNAYMWEHVLHQQQFPNPCSFPPSKIAYAALLLALEGSFLPLVEKQGVCQTLLEVADISAHTPNLTEAYNWLAFSKTLQEQLVMNHQLQRMGSTTTTTSVPASIPQQCPPPAIIEPEVDEPMLSDSTTMAEPTMNTSHDLIDLSGEPVVTVITTDDDSENMKQLESPLSSHVDDDDDDVQEEVDTGSEVIFFTHTHSGDGFEVVSDGSECDGLHRISQDEDDDSLAAGHVHNPEDDEDGDIRAEDCGRLVSWDEGELVLTESLDEDGFEVSYADGLKGHDVDHLASLVASPRMVTL